MEKRVESSENSWMKKTMLVGDSSSLHLETRESYFHLREDLDRYLVQCFFRRESHSQIIESTWPWRECTSSNPCPVKLLIQDIHVPLPLPHLNALGI